MTHKVFDVPKNETYVPMQVGAALNKDLGYLRDDRGDNISDLNPYFGELTGYYWVWKNFHDADIVGVCHYRRYFGVDGRLMDASEYENIIKEYDIMISNLVETEMSNYKEEFGHAHNIEDLLLVGEAIKELYPSYYESFEKALQRNKTCYGNLCVMRKQLFDEYCEWLFSIFLWMLDKVDVSGYDAYHKRLYGFLSENLISVFADAKGLSTKNGTVYITDEKAETKELKLAMSQLVKEKKFSEAREMMTNYIQIRPDVILPLSDISGEIADINVILGILESEEKLGLYSFYRLGESLKELIVIYRKLKIVIDKINNGIAASEEEMVFFKECNISDIAKGVMTIN